MNNVICLKWGSKYSSEYVNKLFNSVKRNCKKEINFFCLTEDKRGLDKKIKIIDLNEKCKNAKLEGWWIKPSIFELKELEGQTVFLDLDVVIVSSIDFLFTNNDDSSFYYIQDFYYPHHHANGVDRINSSVMVFNNKFHFGISEYFFNNLDYCSSRNFDGDQDFISEYIKDNFHCKRINDEFVWSYKRGYERDFFKQIKGIPKNGKICIFHGNPNPDQVKDEWVKTNWI